MARLTHRLIIPGVDQQTLLASRYTWLLLLVAWWPAPAWSFDTTRPENPESSSLHFDYISSQPGLSRNRVWCIEQDRNGFMWFGTDNGLYKYDGYQGTGFTAARSGGKGTLRSADITDIHADREGNIWVATQGGGLHQIHPETGAVTAYPVKGFEHSPWEDLSSLFEDPRGLLWMGTAKGLARFDPRTHRFTLYPTPNGKMIEQPRMDAAGMLWAGNAEGVYRLDPGTGKFTLYPLRTPAGIQLSVGAFHLAADGMAWAGTLGNGLHQFDTRNPAGGFTPYNPRGLINPHLWLGGILEAEGYLWLATSEGVQRLHPQTAGVITFRSDPSLPGTLSSNDVKSVFRDRSGNLWVGTGNGVNKAALYRQPIDVYQITPVPFPFHRQENEINSVLEDHTGTGWAGSASKGLYRLDLPSGRLVPVPLHPGKKTAFLANQVWPLVETPQGELWVGTDMEGGLYRLNRATGRFTRYACPFYVRVLACDPGGTLWVGGWRDEIASFDPRTARFTHFKTFSRDSEGLSSGYINDLMVSRSGSIWVATSTGLGRLHPATGRITRYAAPGTDGLNDAPLTLFEDEKGIIWVGTSRGGVNRLDTTTGAFTYLTTRQGLPSNKVTSITGDSAGNLWFGTDQGLSRYNPGRNAFRTFDQSDGLPENEFRVTANARGRRGKLLFGTKNGLVMIHPDRMLENAYPPPTFITRFTVMERSQPLGRDSVWLPHHQNFISFEFAALHYANAGKNQYAYRLEGVDRDWVPAGTRRYVSYPNLSPGTYTFRVKSAAHHNAWGAAARALTIVIRPPFWQTAWAYGAYGLLAASLLLLGRREVIRRERLKARLALERVTSDKLREMDSLKSQFFANISHEFRTPLTVILGAVEKLAQENIPTAEGKWGLQAIGRHANRLLELINQLLDLSKLEAGKQQLHPLPGELAGFLKYVTASFVPLFERKGIAYQYQVPGAPCWVQYDKDSLQKILSNLLSNALKFTPEGGTVAVTIEARQHADGIELLIGVRDTGIGIPPAQLSRIFDRFHQVDASLTRAYEGTGIGLALAKELVALHRGSITAESSPGRGTLFSVSLPLAVCDPIPTESVGRGNAEPVHAETLPVSDQDTGHAVELPSGKPKLSVQLLVVEDNADLRHFISRQLSGTYKLMEAENGLKGWERALQTLPDLVITDSMMPELDGVSLCRKLKSDPRTSHIPVILLTARADEEHKLEGLGNGADDYLTKPFRLAELQIRIKNLIEGRRLLREQFSRHITADPRPLTVTSDDERFLQRALEIMEVQMGNADFDVEAFSREIGMSRSHLHRKLTALTGLSPNEFIRTMRLKRAADLLRQHSGNVSEIAYQVGFGSLNYFTKCFRQQYGQTPTDYQASLP